MPAECSHAEPRERARALAIDANSTPSVTSEPRETQLVPQGCFFRSMEFDGARPPRSDGPIQGGASGQLFVGVEPAKLQAKVICRD